MRTIALLAAVLSLGLVHGAAGDFQIDAGYPGGNVRVLRQEGSVFTLAPDLRDTRKQEWWFYFNFRLRGPAGVPVTIRFEDKNPIGVRGPAVSTDRGLTWKWLGAESVAKEESASPVAWSFQATVPAGAAEIRYAFAPPYLEEHFQRWAGAQRANPGLRISELCRSRKGRSVELIQAGCLDAGKARGVVLLTARHHACESMASFALEGLLSAVLADDELGKAWRERWSVVALPFTDKDGVEDGDQGKNREPHDHNRDYNEAPLYPEVAAWMKLGEGLKPRVAFSLDMHCPHIRGPWNDRVYLVGATLPEMAQRERAFAATLERVRQGPLPFRVADGYLAAGSGWNTPGNFADGRSSGRWARETFPGAAFAGTIEIAYADAFGVEVNADSARALGRDLARAIRQHLEP